jgi:hypothetical protein
VFRFVLARDGEVRECVFYSHSLAEAVALAESWTKAHGWEIVR